MPEGTEHQYCQLSAVEIYLPSWQLDVSRKTEMCEDDVELEPHSILSPMDSIWHPLVDLVSHPIYSAGPGKGEYF